MTGALLRIRPAALAPALAAVLMAPSAGQGQEPLRVTSVEVGDAAQGAGSVEVSVLNPSEAPVLVVLDVRAEPGLWLIPNTQRQFARELKPGEQAVLRGSYALERLSREATVRISIGPGEDLEAGGVTYHRITRLDYRQTFDVGANHPEAWDPAEHFVVLREGPLTIHAWRGSAAHREADTIARERLRALHALTDMLAVEPPDSVRLVFYADEATKAEQTGHRGIGWAFGRTLVEVYNDSVRIDPYHELAHIVADAAGDPPALLSEGFAIYASTTLGADALAFLGHPGKAPDEVVCAARPEETVSLEELLALTEIGSREGRTSMEYAAAGSFVRYLVDTHGMDRFRTAYGALELGAGPEENARRLGAVYGRGVAELEREWLEALSARCGRLIGSGP